MHAELKHISPNDFLDWEAFAAAERPEPWDDFGWFTLSIGHEGGEGADLFQVLVYTPATVSRAKGEVGFRGVVVEMFEPEVIARTLREHVSAVAGGGSAGRTG